MFITLRKTKLVFQEFLLRVLIIPAEPAKKNDRCYKTNYSKRNDLGKFLTTARNSVESD